MGPGQEVVYAYSMNIFLGADHRGVALKDMLKAYLIQQGHEVHDAGAEEVNPTDDYPAYAVAVGQAVAQDPARRGIVVCGSGIGMAIAANKISGIRAAAVTNTTLAKMSRQDDNTNVLSLGTDFLTAEEAKTVVDIWLATEFSGAISDDSIK